MAFPIPTFCILGSVEDSLIKYAVLVTRYQGKWVFCRHKDRSTWELPGGHREPGETPMETARRELYEESGAITANIVPLGVYKLFDYGMLFFAEILELDKIPDNSEIGEIQFFDDIPNDLTYAGVHNYLFSWVRNFSKPSV